MDEKIDVDELPPCDSEPKAATRFEKAMRKIVGVSKDELERREKAWRKGRGRLWRR
jgi:hypothetical protein